MHPDSLPIVRLGDVASMTSGGTPSSSVRQYYGGGIPWVSIADMTSGGKYITKTQKTLSEEGLSASAAKLYEPNVVLYAMYASLGECSISRGRVTSSQAILAIKPGTKLDSDYLYYVLQSIKSRVKTIGQQGTQSNLNANMVRDFKIPLPSPEAQRQIARILGDVDLSISSVERLIAKKQAIKQGMMQELFSGTSRLPGFDSPWTPTAIASLGPLLKGRGVKRDDVRAAGVPCIRYGELYTTFSNYTHTTVSFVDADVASTALPITEGDLLFAGSGETKADIGTCVAYVGRSPAVAGGDIIVLRAPSVNPVFLASLLNTPQISAMKARLGQGDAVVHISASAIAELQVELPERSEQDAIARLIVDADRDLAAQATRLDVLRNIRQGMMQEVLTGRTRLTRQAVAA